MSEWTPDTLKTYFDSIFDSFENSINHRFQSISDAVTKAEAATEKRFEGVNEFRAQAEDRQRTYIPRKEVEVMSENLTKQDDILDKKIDVLDKKIERIQNIKQGGNTTWAYVFAAISLLLALVTLIIKFNSIK